MCHVISEALPTRRKHECCDQHMIHNCNSLVVIARKWRHGIIATSTHHFIYFCYFELDIVLIAAFINDKSTGV